MEAAAPIIVIVLGALIVVFKGVMGMGLGYGGLGRLLLDRLGSIGARAFYVVIGLIVVALGVLMIFYPESFGLSI